MKFKLREFNKNLGGYVNLPEFYTFIICLLIGCIFALTLNINGQEKQDPPALERWQHSLAIPVDELGELMVPQDKEKQTPAKAEKPAPVKTWKLPGYMQENLQRELDDFNKRFDAKVQAYKKELKTRFVEFKDMPDDAILYLEGGFFITRSDFRKLQNQLREKQKREVKGDDKTTN